jgi:hypothetical protein
MVGIAILLFLWALSAVAQPRAESEIRDLKFQTRPGELQSGNGESGIGNSAGPDSQLPNPDSHPARLAGRRRERINKQLAGYGRTPVEGSDEIGHFKWS